MTNPIEENRPASSRPLTWNDGPQTKAHRDQVEPVYPVFLTHLTDIITVVVGGGAVAARKVRGLLAAAADVYVISPELAPELQELYAEGRLVWIARRYMPGDLAQARLVIAATNLRAVNQAVAQEASTLRILCNVVDAPAEGNFHVPAVLREEDAVIAVGTGGTQPRLATQLRDWIATQLHRFWNDSGGV